MYSTINIKRKLYKVEHGKAVMILGPSGSGKSTAIRTLDPKKTFIFSALGKGLPFKNSGKYYKVYDREKNPDGNMIVTSSSKSITKWLGYISENKPEITTCVIDDSTFLPAKELDRRRDEVGYNKFNDIAHDFLTITETANTLRGDLTIYFLHHSRIQGDGVLEDKHTTAQSFGKLIDEKLASIEAQFEIVLLSCKLVNKDGEIQYKFKTRDGFSSTKSPIDMFEDEYINNDLELVNKTIRCYYDETECEKEKTIK